MLSLMDPSEYLQFAKRLRYKKPAEAGVYMIYCKTSGKAYIGSSGRLYSRLSGHKAHLNNKRHRNPHLQSAYNLYGKDAFVFLVLETTERRDSEFLLERENHFLLQLDRNKVYNIAVPATLGGPSGGTISAEHKAAISRASKGHTYLRGIKRDREVVEHIAAQLRGRKHTPEQIAKAAAAKAAAFLAKPDIYKGEQNGRAKLTAEKVREIRALYSGGKTQTELAGLFGVDQAIISRVVLRKSWKHVE